MGKDERIRIYYRKIALGLTAPISTAQVSLLWFMMWSCIHSTSFEPWFWYDQVIPHDGTDQRLNFLLVWYFSVKTICWEGLFQCSCRLTAHWNNYVLALMSGPVSLNLGIFFLGFVSYSILYLHTSTKWIPTQALPQTLLLHVLLAIALLLTFDPHWGQQSWGWGTRWCSSFSPGAISSNTHSYLYSSRVENLHSSFLNWGGQRRGSCVEEPGSYSHICNPVFFFLFFISNFEYVFPFSNWTVALHTTH